MTFYSKTTREEHKEGNLRFLMKIDIKVEAGNSNFRDPQFGKKMQALLPPGYPP
jgi:hypothetical protein